MRTGTPSHAPTGCERTRVRVLIMIVAVPLLLSVVLLAQDQPGPVCNHAQMMGLVESGRRLLAEKKYDTAAREFHRALDACPERRTILLELAQALTFERKFDEAERAASDFLRTQSDSEQGLLVLGNSYFMSQRFEASEKIARRVLEAEPNNIAALTLKANADYLLGQEEPAEHTFLRVIELDPKNEEAIYSLGRIYYQQNRFEPAIARFKSVLELNPGFYKAYDNLGLCYEAIHKDREAIEHYIRALELVYKGHPEYDWPYANLANLLLKRGENEKAFTLAAEAAQRNPNSARNFYLTARALSRLGRPELAIKWLKRSIELDATYAEPHYLLAQLYSKRGLREQSEKEFEVFQEIRTKQPTQRR